MKKLRIYVDTSVIGGCCDAEFAAWSNGLMWDFQRGLYRPVLSEIVAAEIQRAPEEVLLKYAELLSYDPEFAELTEDAAELARVYLERGAVGSDFENDALHIALATVANVDVLVSWNFKHVVRLDKIRLFNAANIELGFKTLQIYSPREVTTHDNSSG
ncbi:MAG: type II toxin-antitoxin system VapC family toxin [Planctomycetes bacterium]|nr:type II toxin-antitoxin system VapC family toxin [Planctomycetota bacterium]